MANKVLSDCIKKAQQMSAIAPLLVKELVDMESRQIEGVMDEREKAHRRMEDPIRIIILKAAMEFPNNWEKVADIATTRIKELMDEEVRKRCDICKGENYGRR